jgi:hypothetical protein
MRLPLVHLENLTFRTKKIISPEFPMRICSLVEKQKLYLIGGKLLVLARLMLKD